MGEPWRAECGALLFLLAACSCSADQVSTAAPSSTIGRVASAPPTRPSDLPVLPEEGVVIRSLGTVGVSAQVVGRSTFESALGTPLPARVLMTGPREGADILFLDAAPNIHDIRVCASPGSPGRTIYTISVNGLRTSSNDAGQYVAYLVSSSYFVMAWDEPTSTALQRALGVLPARC
jgi:hypothetical protein